MTRDEALNKTIRILTYHQVNFCKSKEAVANMNEIIDALEKIDQEPCDDVVNRQAVLDINERHHGQMPNHVNHEIWKEIKALPSVTPQPCDDAISRQEVLDEIDKRFDLAKPFKQLIKSMPPVTPQQNPNIKALGEDIRICQKSITDKKVLIGFNMAVALCNKHLAESEEKG